PSMTRGFWNNFDRYIETYWTRFPGKWYHGDWAFVDRQGYWFLEGRADDVIKVAGRRVGPAEIESVLNSHALIAESAAIGLPDKVKGERIHCFIQLKPCAKKDIRLIESAKALVVQDLGKTLEPDRIIIVDDLPRTRSGKIIRRLIRAVILSDESAAIDTSMLENPDSLEKIKSGWAAQI
ncbi:MAG: AMP-binding enzyme, partial [Nitrososphaerales archaeon]